MNDVWHYTPINKNDEQNKGRSWVPIFRKLFGDDSVPSSDEDGMRENIREQNMAQAVMYNSRAGFGLPIG